jgi:hypothetical protein
MKIIQKTVQEIGGGTLPEQSEPFHPAPIQHLEFPPLASRVAHTPADAATPERRHYIMRDSVMTWRDLPKKPGRHTGSERLRDDGIGDGALERVRCRGQNHQEDANTAS